MKTCLLLLGFLSLNTYSQTATVNRPGTAYYCRSIPRFVNTLGFDYKTAALTTSDTRLKGLVLQDLSTPEKPKKYQHPSWSRAGWLAPIVLTEKGDVFLGAVPMVNTLYNPVNEQNTVYKIDTVSQALTPYLAIKSPHPANEQNAFGILGLTYNCNDSSLWVSSIYGSSRQNERGQIVRIDTKSKQQTLVMKNLDAMGLALHSDKEELRLYYGLAREPEIWSVAISPKGEAKGEARKEIDLDLLGSRGDDKARRINFLPNGTMVVWGVHFHFNLIAPTEKLETVYHFARDPNNNQAWTLQRIENSGFRNQAQ